MLFVISNSDGDTDVRMVDEATFLQRLNDGDYGENPHFITMEYLKEHSDTNYWPEGAILVLRHEVVVPAAFTRTTSWGLPK